MRTTHYLLPTVKEIPGDADIISHQLMIRAGMIRQVSAGIYIWLPLGLRVLNKIINIVRQEMNAIKAQEISMPAIQPAELWKESSRWAAYGPLMLKMTDRHEREYCFGPTHEEIITNLMRHELKSYKQLPMSFFQIQTKFRDEIRPRFGVMRAREFLMKDAYSFHIDPESLQQTYDAMYGAYSRIFNRLGLHYRAVEAESGEIGGHISHEFQVLADSGEDIIVYSNSSDYAANIEKATSLVSDINSRPKPSAKMEMIDTPGLYTIKALCNKFNIDIKKTVKTLLVKGEKTPMVALILRGDHELNPFKAEKLDEIATPLKWVDKDEIKQIIGASPGSIGPVNLNIPVIVDPEAAVIADFCCGANEDDKHYIHVNWERDLPLGNVADVRKVQVNDPSPDGKGKLVLTRGIEVGHIFQLGDKYSRAMQATVLDEKGKANYLEMGCYGIGISRIIAAAIEQNHDKYGIIWPRPLAPFQVAIIPINLHKSYRVREVCTRLYLDLQDIGIEVIYDDRNERPGVKFADMDLIGVPTQIIVGEKGLDQNIVEYKTRATQTTENVELSNIIAKIKEVLRKP